MFVGRGVRRGKSRGQGAGVAVPVHDEHGGVVAHCPAGDVQDGAGEHLHGLARVQVTECAEEPFDLGLGSVALEHPVGHQGEPVTGKELEALHGVRLVRCHA